MRFLPVLAVLGHVGGCAHVPGFGGVGRAASSAERVAAPASAAVRAAAEVTRTAAIVGDALLEGAAAPTDAPDEAAPGPGTPDDSFPCGDARDCSGGERPPAPDWPPPPPPDPPPLPR
ncbi:MAG TPA: hypothetical protein VMB50_07460 [Myxococcales bacterium]|nr:hypothetical protein [Myxococcales bacterium]